MIKTHQKTMKNEKKRGKLQFSIFWKIFAPLEAKMMKHDKKNAKKNEKNPRKIAIFHFLDFFSPLEAKMMKHD